jgi:hypothetical protein
MITLPRIRLVNQDQEESGPGELLGNVAGGGIQGGGGTDV